MGTINITNKFLLHEVRVTGQKHDFINDVNALVTVAVNDTNAILLRLLTRTLPTSGQPVATLSGRLLNWTFINSQPVRSVALVTLNQQQVTCRGVLTIVVSCRGLRAADNGACRLWSARISRSEILDWHWI